jgi:hypothetical protein
MTLTTETGVRLPHFAPAYLYRGECGLFRETKSSLVRLGDEPDWTVEDLDRFAHLLYALTHRFQRPAYDETEKNAEGLLQHYGVPTQVLDFTASPEIAAAFAAASAAGAGRICVLAIQRSSGIKIVNYAEHKLAGRALKQEAFGIAPNRDSFHDFKSKEAAAFITAEWLEFPVTTNDVTFCRPAYEWLMDVVSDPGAGIVRFEIYGYVARYGKLPPRIVNLLTRPEGVPMVPRCHRVVGVDEGTSEVITNHEPPSTVSFDAACERAWTRAEWSGSIDPVNTYFGQSIPTEPGAVFAFPITLHGTAATTSEEYDTRQIV